MPFVIRRTETLSDRIADLAILNKNIANKTIEGGKLVSRAIGSPQLGSAVIGRTVQDEALTRSKMFYPDRIMHEALRVEFTDLGSAKTSLTAAYKSYAKAYTRPPVLSFFEQDSGIAYVYPSRIVEGSFAHIGSPGGKYFRYYAWAPGTTPK